MQLSRLLCGDACDPHLMVHSYAVWDLGCLQTTQVHDFFLGVADYGSERGSRLYSRPIV